MLRAPKIDLTREIEITFDGIYDLKERKNSAEELSRRDIARKN
jgi:hypothetical protein